MSVEDENSKRKQDISSDELGKAVLKNSGKAIGKGIGITSKLIGTATKILGTTISEVTSGVTTVSDLFKQSAHVLKNGANVPTDAEKADIHTYIRKFPEYVEFALNHKDALENETEKSNDADSQTSQDK